MSSLMLLFIGTAYLVNGLTGLKKLDPKGSAPVNLIVGFFLCLLTIHLALGLDAGLPETPSADVISVVGYPLFAITFLYVGILNYTGHDSAGLGWYCGWSAAISAGLAIANGLLFGEVNSCLLWMVWTVVFLALFLTMIMNYSHLQRITGQFLLLAGFTTCVVPAAMMMLGLWNTSSTFFIGLMELGTIVYYFLGVARAVSTRNNLVT